MLPRNPFLLSAALLLLAGCGSDPGSGTKTLYVDATAHSDGSADNTWIKVTVRQGANNGPYVQGAQVLAISDRGTQLTLNWAGIFGIGDYEASGFPWEPGWRLRITSGADKLEGYVLAPGLTNLTSPVGGTPFVRANQQPLIVKWNDANGRSAQTVDIRLERANYDQLRSGDSGEFDVPAGTWSQAYSSERLTVTRSTTVSLAGGVDGSTFKAETFSQTQFPVQ